MDIYINYPCHGEVYIYRFGLRDRCAVMRAIGMQAVDPKLSFDWRDAYKIEQRIDLLCDAANRVKVELKHATEFQTRRFE